MLTIKQKKLLDYIKSYYEEKDFFPTFDEMKDNLSIKSKSGIYKLLSSLEDKGYIRKTPHKARAIEFLKDLNFFSVTSFSSINATTISPVSAKFVLLITTISPSWIPSSII